MINTIDIGMLPDEAKIALLDFYEFIKSKYKVQKRDRNRSQKKSIEIMNKGLYNLPGDYSFNREELYD